MSSLDLVPGGCCPEYGRGIGGLVTIDTRAPRSDTIHGVVAADIIDAAAMVEGPIGDDKTRFMAAFRKSYLDQTSIAAVTKVQGREQPLPHPPGTATPLCASSATCARTASRSKTSWRSDRATGSRGWTTPTRAG